MYNIVAQCRKKNLMHFIKQLFYAIVHELTRKNKHKILLYESLIISPMNKIKRKQRYF